MSVRRHDAPTSTPLDIETKVYQFEGLSLPKSAITERWKYLGHHVVGGSNSEDNLKVILRDSDNVKPDVKKPFNFCTKIEWALNDLKKYGSMDDIRTVDPMSASIHFGVYKIHKKQIWKRSAYRSVSDPLSVDLDTSDKILCFFERRISNTYNPIVTNEANNLISRVRRNIPTSRFLLGMTLYKNISHHPHDPPYIELIVEFTVTTGQGGVFKDVLDSYFSEVFEQFEDDFGFCYGLYQRHQLVTSNEYQPKVRLDSTS